jgi:hypothetical protein
MPSPKFYFTRCLHSANPSPNDTPLALWPVPVRQGSDKGAQDDPAASIRSVYV